MISRTGKERILAFLGPGALVGEMSIIDRLPRSANAVAVRPAILSFLGRTEFQHFAKIHPEVYESLVALLIARLRETDMAVAAGTFLPVRGRIARYGSATSDYVRFTPSEGITQLVPSREARVYDCGVGPREDRSCIIGPDNPDDGPPGKPLGR